MIGGNKFIVIDHFFDDPDRIRGGVLSKLRFEKLPGVYFPGVVSEFPSKVIHPQISFERIAKEIIEPIRINPMMQQGCFRLSKEKDEARALIHIDFCDLTAVVYLTPNLPRECGTSFWKHKGLNSERHFPAHNSEIKLLLQDRKISYVEYTQTMLRDTANHALWSETDRVDYQYNRCVVFDPTHFHSHTKLAGNDMESGRLTQNFFLDYIDPKKSYRWHF